MSSNSPAAALIADAIARIEERRDVLDRLADRGEEMIDRLAAGETVEIAGRKPFADPQRAFAVIVRAVRLCLALACRLDEELIALLRGGPIPTLDILAPEASEPVPAPVAKPAPEAPAPVITPRERIARAVDVIIESEARDHEAAERLHTYVQEHLIEGEDYDAYLHQPWRVVVQAICADLGLHPDWSVLKDEERLAGPFEPRVFPPQEGPPEKTNPSPPAGEGGPRSGSDEGSRPTFSDRLRRDNSS